jgi:hypothetical protein
MPMNWGHWFLLIAVLAIGYAVGARQLVAIPYLAPSS